MKHDTNPVVGQCCNFASRQVYGRCPECGREQQDAPECEAVTALRRIARYDEQPIWNDSRDDSANEMLAIARRALGEPEE